MIGYVNMDKVLMTCCLYFMLMRVCINGTWSKPDPNDSEYMQWIVRDTAVKAKMRLTLYGILYPVMIISALITTGGRYYVPNNIRYSVVSAGLALLTSAVGLILDKESYHAPEGKPTFRWLRRLMYIIPLALFVGGIFVYKW